LQDNLIVSTIVTPIQLKRKKTMKQKIITTLIECTLAIIIFGGIGVMLAWRG
jgi:hypothetical protein